MTLKEVLKGKKFRIIYSTYLVPNIVHIPRKFLKKNHDKTVNETWIKYDIRDCGSLKTILSIRTPNDEFNQRFELFINNKKQIVDVAVARCLFQEVRSLFYGQEKASERRLAQMKMAQFKQKRNQIYQKISNEIQK